MKKAIRSVFLAFVFLTVFVSACAPAPTPPPTSIPPTSTPLPTETSVPTNTPVPTKTPIPPTATVPAPDKSLEYLNGVQVIYNETFDNPPIGGGGWVLNSGIIKNGILELVGKNWNGLGLDREFKEGEGVVIDFTYTKGSVFEIYIDKGSWYTDPYKRYGVYIENNYARVNVWAGKNGLGGAILSGNFTPKPDITYSLLIAILPNGEFLGVIWDPSDPSKTIYYREKIGKTWTNLNWIFHVGADKGTIHFDNFRKIKFDSVK